MALFGKDEQVPPPKVDLSVPPTDSVMAMRNQGLSNNQVIQSLQRQGFDSGIILDAMNQADLKQRIDKVPESNDEPKEPINKMQIHGGPAPQQPQDNSMSQPAALGFREDNNYGGNQPQENMAPPPNIPPPDMAPNDMPPSDMPPPDMPPPLDDDPGMGGSFSEPYSSSYSPPPAYDAPPVEPMSSHVVEQISIERIEEIAEAIIDEKWNEIVRSINKIVDWKDRTETKIAKIEQKFVDIRREFENLSQGILGKIGEYDKNLGDLGVEIKAMEKVFQNIIPSLTENVHSLEKITSKLKNE